MNKKQKITLAALGTFAIFNIGVYIGGEVTKKAILDKLDSYLDSYEESIDKNNIYNQFFTICKDNSDSGDVRWIYD